MEAEQRRAENRLAAYRPYTKQKAFHADGSKYRERLFMAGNQLGKTLAGGFETAMHLTGKYPDWWEGKRFDKGIVAWAGGVTREALRDGAQRMLMGRAGKWGTGTIPKVDIVSHTASRGIPDGVDTATIRHVSGQTSHLVFKSYDQGREKWQADSIDLGWLDEEPDSDIYTECLTRTNATGGIVFLTFTPLLGMSEVVRRFLMEGDNPDRSVTQMTIDDAEHYSAEERQRIVSSYAPHEREARTKGVPIMGSGRIFPVPEESIAVPPMELPDYWVRIGGLDFGWDHPTAAVELAWDRDADCIYVTKAYRVREATPVIHAAALKPWGEWLPWAWPHDGLQHDKGGSGEQLAQQYRDQGLALLPERATFPDGSNGLEAGLMAMLDRMQTARLKVFSNLVPWFEEFRLYHRKDGKVVALHDDLLSATRYAMMMLRHAATPKPRFTQQFASQDGFYM